MFQTMLTLFMFTLVLDRSKGLVSRQASGSPLSSSSLSSTPPRQSAHNQSYFSSAESPVTQEYLCSASVAYESHQKKRGRFRSVQRRDFLIQKLGFLIGIQTASGLITSIPLVANADELQESLFDSNELPNSVEVPNSAEVRRKPRSPLESLLPATKFRLILDRAIAIAEKASNVDRQKQTHYLEDLSNLLLRPQNYTAKLSPVPDRPGQQYLDAYRRKLGELSPLEQPGALLQQRGEIGAWRRLKRQERAREESDEIRAALNAYTNDLSFRTDAYLFNESKEMKSRMIREDLITSDLGLRYLYRNDVLDFMDDAKSELQYLLSIAANEEQSSSLDLSELIELLGKADKALEKWFSLIDEEDVKKAKETVASL